MASTYNSFMQIEQVDPGIDVSDLEDREILMLHNALHSYYREFNNGRGVEGWELDDVIEKHGEVREKMEENDLVHEELSELDEVGENLNQSMEVDTEVQSWATQLVQAENRSEFVTDNPPDANWFLEAIQAVNDIDESVDLTEYVTLSYKQVSELKEWEQQWVREIGLEPEQSGAIGYQFNEDTSQGVLLLRDLQEGGESYVTALGTEVLNRSEDVEQSYRAYDALAERIEQGDEATQALTTLSQRDDIGSQFTEGVELGSEVEQGEVVDADEEYRWYVWEGEDEAVSWLDEHDFNSDGDTETDGEFLVIENPEAEDEHDTYRREWVGDASTPDDWNGDPGEIEGDDPRPVLFNWGVEDDENVEISSFWFAVDPPEGGETEEQSLDDLLQGEIIDDTDAGEHRWYVWEQEEAEQWLTNHNFRVPEPEQEGEFLTYEIEDPGEYEILNNDWHGPWGVPHNFVAGLDERPVLLTLGKDDEDDLQAEVQAVKFQVERPAELPELQQFGIKDAEQDFYWYQWDKSEASTWLQGRGISAGVGHEDGKFYSYEVNDAEEYDELQTTWEGKRLPPDEDKLAGGEKPRLVTYGVTQDGEREVQEVKFLTQMATNQLLSRYACRQGLTKSEIEEVIEHE